MRLKKSISIFLSLYPHFLEPEWARDLYEVFLQKVPWQHDPIKVFGKTYMQPRLTSLHGTTRQSYGYSNIRMHPKPMIPEMVDLLKRIAQVDTANFNIVLLNLYCTINWGVIIIKFYFYNFLQHKWPLYTYIYSSYLA